MQVDPAGSAPLGPLSSGLVCEVGSVPGSFLGSTASATSTPIGLFGWGWCSRACSCSCQGQFLLKLENRVVLGLNGAEGGAFSTNIRWDPLLGSLEVVHSSG